MASVNCPSCGATLQAEGVVPGTSVQCARCGVSFTVGLGAQQTSGKAIASLFLGLVSFIGLCITGLPAIIFGAMALSDIRRSQGQLSGRGLAITGIVTGSLCGLVCTPLVGAITWLSVSVANETQLTEDPAEIAVVAQKIGDFEPPAGLEPDGAMDMGMFGFRMIMYTDPASESEPGDATAANAFAMVMQFPAWIPLTRQDMEMQMRQQWRNQGELDMVIEDTNEITYTAGDQEHVITETIGTEQKTGRKMRQYLGLLQLEAGPTMVMVFTFEPGENEPEPPPDQPPRVQLTEGQVKEFFQSFHD